MSEHKVVIKLLEKGLERITKGWTQKFVARDASDHPVAALSTTATCWCAIGALQAKNALWYEEVSAKQELAKTLWDSGYQEVKYSDGMSDEEGLSDYIANVNDSTVMTQARMIELFEKTIDRLRAETPVPSGA